MAPRVIHTAQALVDEVVELGLEVDEGGGGRLFGEPAFEGLLEAFDLPAGRGVIGPGVLVGDVEGGEGGLELVAAAATAGRITLTGSTKRVNQWLISAPATTGTTTICTRLSSMPATSTGTVLPT